MDREPTRPWFRIVVAVCVASFLWTGALSGPSGARAQYAEPAEVAPSHTSPASSRGEWYGLGMAIGDAAFLGAMIGGYYLTAPADDDSGGGFGGVGMIPGYLLLLAVDPIIHWANGNVGRGFLSFGMTATAGLFAALFADGGGDTLIVLGSLLIAVAKAVDIGVFAYRRPRRHVGMEITPSIGFARRGALMGATLLF